MTEKVKAAEVKRVGDGERGEQMIRYKREREEVGKP